jgi:5-methylcytosine-specific restriction enzyme A
MTAKLANPAAAKEPRKTWYSLQIWKNIRRHQLQAEPLCSLCLADGKVEPATVVDHIEPHGGDYTKFIRGKLRSLCKPHHDGLQPGFKHKGYSNEIGVDGYPTDPAHPFYHVR